MFFKSVLKNFSNFTEKQLCWSLFLIKFQALKHVTLLKKTPTQVLSCEIFEIFKNTYFQEHLRWLSLDWEGWHNWLSFYQYSRATMIRVFGDFLVTEAFALRYSVKKVFSKLPQNSQEKPVPESLFLIRLQT